MDKANFTLWKRLCTSPHHYPMCEDVWEQSMQQDIDSDGRLLFDDLQTLWLDQGFIQYGHTAFGFDESGEISADVHHPVIRQFSFSDTDQGQQLLQAAVDALGNKDRIYAFFHYFGLSACGRHGKLHEKDSHIAALLIQNGFQVEHENVYYSRCLDDESNAPSSITLSWKPQSCGGCREFAAVFQGQEIGWGQVHFLPQGKIAYLRWIYIDSTRQHQGYGTGTMQALFHDLYCMGIRRFDTDTALNNRIAQGYYEKCGFTNEGITRSYYK